MNLETTSWLEIESYLHVSDGVIIPTGSIEQHGPIGLIGTDTICAREIATLVGGTIVIPHLRRAFEYWEALENKK